MGSCADTVGRGQSHRAYRWRGRNTAAFRDWRSLRCESCLLCAARLAHVQLRRARARSLATLSTGFGPSFTRSACLITPATRRPHVMVRVQAARLEPCSCSLDTAHWFAPRGQPCSRTAARWLLARYHQHARAPLLRSNPYNRAPASRGTHVLASLRAHVGRAGTKQLKSQAPPAPRRKEKSMSRGPLA